MLAKVSSALIAPFAILVGFATGMLVYQHNMNNHLEIVSAEADAVLALSSSYVAQYSKLRSEFNHSNMPVPAKFRAQAAKRFNGSYSGDDHFMALMVGMPDRYIETPPTDSGMSSALNSMKVDSMKPNSQLINLNGEAVLRSMFPSIANEKSCINCHNSIQDISEPWAIGDLMGAYVIDRGVERTKNRYTIYASVAGLLVTITLLFGYTAFVQHQNLRRLAHRLSVLAESDPLTSCLNRRGLNSRADMISQENLGNVALLALDIDHFKAINDVHGHDVGDLVLVWFSKIIRFELRKHDVFARVGGEEFIVCLVDTSEEVAKSISNRICRRVAENPFFNDSDAIPVTVSVGAVQMSRTPEHPLKYYSQIADKLLYLAKKQGRNRVVWSAS